MPACLIEFGFINSSEDNRLFDENMTSYAKAITAAVQSTYDQYGDTDLLPEDEAVSTEEGAEGDLSHGMRLSYPAIDNVSALSSETLDWGQGGDADEYNRPTGCLSYSLFRRPKRKYILPWTKDMSMDARRRFWIP